MATYNSDIADSGYFEEVVDGIIRATDQLAYRAIASLLGVNVDDLRALVHDYAIFGSKEEEIDPGQAIRDALAKIRAEEVAFRQDPEGEKDGEYLKAFLAQLENDPEDERNVRMFHELVLPRSRKGNSS